MSVVISLRELRNDLSRCYAYELEDVFVDVLGADLVLPRFRGRPRTAKFYERAIRRSRRAFGGRLAPPGVSIDVDLDAADFAYVHVQFPWDLAFLESIPRWRSRVGVAACYIEEAWVADIQRLSGYRRWFEQFDAVYMGIGASAEAWAERTGLAISYLPYSVDALEFAPADHETARGIDVINIGRRSLATHEALVGWSRANDRFYYFDSFRPAGVKDPAEHRYLLGALMANSRIAIANRGVGADPERTNNQHALPARFFEAAAGGALLVGASPDADEFEEHFDWTDSFIDMPFDAPDVADRVEELLGDESRLTKAHRRNVAQCLRRHDHVHRLDAIARDLGVPFDDLTAPRREETAALAKTFD